MRLHKRHVTALREAARGEGMHVCGAPGCREKTIDQLIDSGLVEYSLCEYHRGWLCPRLCITEAGREAIEAYNREHGGKP